MIPNNSWIRIVLAFVFLVQASQLASANEADNLAVLPLAVDAITDTQGGGRETETAAA